MSITQLDEKVHKVEHKDWYAIVVRIPRHKGYPYRAFVYPPEDIEFTIQITRFRSLDDVEPELENYKRLWDMEGHLWDVP